MRLDASCHISCGCLLRAILQHFLMQLCVAICCVVDLKQAINPPAFARSIHPLLVEKEQAQSWNSELRRAPKVVFDPCMPAHMLAMDTAVTRTTARVCYARSEHEHRAPSTDICTRPRSPLLVCTLARVINYAQVAPESLRTRFSM